MGEGKPFSRSRPGTYQGSGTGKDTRKETGTEKVINIVYAMTRAVYRWILPSLRSLAEHNPNARVFVVCEDDALPFPIPVDAEIINASGQEWFPETEQECVRRVAGKCDGHAAERVCDLIRSIL